MEKKVGKVLGSGVVLQRSMSPSAKSRGRHSLVAERLSSASPESTVEFYPYRLKAAVVKADITNLFARQRLT